MPFVREIPTAGVTLQDRRDPFGPVIGLWRHIERKYGVKRETAAKFREPKIQQNNTYATHRIDEQMDRIQTALDGYSKAEIHQALYINSFPVAKKVATYDFNLQKNDDLRNEILDELILIDEQIQQLNVDIERARLTANYDLLVVLEQKVRHLEEMNQLILDNFFFVL